MAGPAPVYLDNNATSPLCPEAREAMLPLLGGECGNPSSLHAFGRRAREALGTARARVAALLGAKPSEVVFTSGGTESDALAVLGALEAAGEARRHVVASAVEHPAVRGLLRALRDAGRIALSEVPPGPDGALDPGRVLAAVREDTALVTVMWANNETGILHPVEAIARGCRERGVPFHSDAVQAAGKVPVDLARVPADLLSVASHKMHGPRGAGALVVRRGARWRPWPVSGHQEGGRRGGTEDVAALAGFGAAADAARGREGGEGVAALRDRFEALVLAAVPGSRRSSAAEPRVPNTSSLLLPGLEGESLLLRLDALGIAIATGSACTAGSLEPSHVLLAMGIPREEARGAIRVSLSRFTAAEEVERAAAAVAAEAAALRRPGSTRGGPRSPSRTRGASGRA
jgi:cysteine desulfurase